MRQMALVAAHCLVSITKVRGGLLWLLSAWSMSLKGAEGHFDTLCLVNGTKGQEALLKCAEGHCGCSPLG